MVKKKAVEAVMAQRPDIERIRSFTGRKLELSIDEVVKSLISYIEQLEELISGASKEGGDTPDGR